MQRAVSYRTQSADLLSSSLNVSSTITPTSSAFNKSLHLFLGRLTELLFRLKSVLFFSKFYYMSTTKHKKLTRERLSRSLVRKYLVASQNRSEIELNSSDNADIKHSFLVQYIKYGESSTKNSVFIISTGNLYM